MPGQGDNRSRRRDGDTAIPAAQKVAARRRRAPGELYVTQTEELEAVAAMVADAGELTAIIVEGRDMPGVCWLAAWLNGRMVGVVGIETIVDAAVMRSLAVVEAMRGRGIGVALVAAARKAALTRGARRLYAISRDAAEYLVRFGFERVAPAVLIDDLTGTFIADYLEAHPEELARLATLRLDISRDGMIER